MAREVRTVDEVIGRLASSSHGVVTRRELLAAGVTADQIRARSDRGSLLAAHRGVYLVGHRAPRPEARYLAAVRACGEGALLSGTAAAWLWRLIRGDAPAAEVTTVGERRIAGVRVRRARAGRRGTTCRGVPVTTVPRTLVDLAAVLDHEGLARACHEAGVLYRTTPAQVEAVMAPNASGAGALRRVMVGDVPVSLSELEREFLRVLRDAGLPLPITNRPAGSHRVDCRWPEHRVTVELDSYRFHSSRHAWERDRHREREAYRRGDAFRRFTWRDVYEQPSLMLAELRELLCAQAAA